MHSLLLRFKKNQTGFTLIELLVVILIIGILVTIAMPIYQGVQDRAKRNADEANRRIIDGALQLYLLENPTADDYNKTIDEDHPLLDGDEPYLKEAPKSPYGTEDSPEYYKIKDGQVYLQTEP